LSRCRPRIFTARKNMFDLQAGRKEERLEVWKFGKLIGKEIER